MDLIELKSFLSKSNEEFNLTLYINGWLNFLQNSPILNEPSLKIYINCVKYFIASDLDTIMRNLLHNIMPKIKRDIIEHFINYSLYYMNLSDSEKDLIKSNNKLELLNKKGIQPIYKYKVITVQTPVKETIDIISEDTLNLTVLEAYELLDKEDIRITYINTFPYEDWKNDKLGLLPTIED